jgi:hypothetical protein
VSRPRIIAVATFRETLGNPFDGLPPYGEDFFAAIGKAVVMWGRLEHALDFLLEIAINIEALSSPRRETAAALGRKLRLLREIYSTCPLLSALKNEANAVIDRISNQSGDRHLVMHSTWVGFEDGPPPCIVMLSVKNRPSGSHYQELKATFAHMGMVAGAFHGGRIAVLRLLEKTDLAGGPKWEEARAQALQEADRLLPMPL